MTGELKNLAKYKIKNENISFIPAPITDVSKWLKENQNIIPVVILEEKYGAVKTRTELSGLNLVYKMRKNYYGGPIIVLSILSMDQIKLIIHQNPSLFKERTERILRTSNIGFFNVREEPNNRKKKIEHFIDENKYLSISRFSMDDIIRFSISHYAAVENLLHDLKNLILSENKLEPLSDEIKELLDIIENDHISLDKRKEFLESRKILQDQIDNTETSKKLVTEMVDSFKNQISNCIIEDINPNDNGRSSELSNNWEVLIIDDNESIAKKITKNLELNKFNCKYATNFNEALDKFDEMDNLIWIISDYRLLKNKSNNTLWQTLQGTDLLQLLHEKAEGKKIHLTILSSKRDIINRANKHIWNPPITFFYKELLQSKESFRIFIETQLPYLKKIHEQNSISFEIPDSWINVYHLTLEKNLPEYRTYIKEDHFNNKEEKLKGQDLANYFLNKKSSKSKGDWKELWNQIKKDVAQKNTWEIFNHEIDEFILENINFGIDRLKNTKNLTPVLERINKKNLLKIMKNRLIWRRIMLACFIIYNKYEPESDNKIIKKPHQFYNDIWEDLKDRLSIKSNPSHFRYINAFEPDEILDSELNFNLKNIPYEEREFIKRFKNMHNLT